MPLLLIALLGIFFPWTAWSQAPKELKHFFEYCYENQLFAGTVVVMEQGQPLYQQSFGFEEEEQKHLLTEHSPFLLASLSKQFTAAAVVYLKSKGQLDYDQAVQHYLPIFPYPNITVRQLLHQTSGLPEYMTFLQQQKEQLQQQYTSTGQVVDNARVAALFAQRRPPLQFEAGSQFAYSNTNYLYLALLIEAVSQQDFGAFLQEKFWEPLGLKNTFVVGKEKKEVVAYQQHPLTGIKKVKKAPTFFRVYGDGGICSSAADLATWFKALDQGQIIPLQELEAAYTPPTAQQKALPYGFGWFVKTLPFNQHKVLTHSGSFAGYNSAVFRDIEGGKTAIVLSHNSHSIQAAINQAVVRILYGMPASLPPLQAANVLHPILQEQGIAAAKAFYQQHQQASQYDFSEKAFNKWGYLLLEMDLLEEAVEVFQWNVARFPKAANVYDSLGEAYLKLKQPQQALVNYQKALELDPSNPLIQQIVQQLQSNQKVSNEH